MIGDVLSHDGHTLTLRDDTTGDAHRIALDQIDDWGVTATGTGYTIGPWLAHYLDDVEDYEAGLHPERDAEGRLLCSMCGTPLGRSSSLL